MLVIITEGLTAFNNNNGDTVMAIIKLFPSSLKPNSKKTETQIVEFEAWQARPFAEKLIREKASLGSQVQVLKGQVRALLDEAKLTQSRDTHNEAISLQLTINEKQKQITKLDKQLIGRK